MRQNQEEKRFRDQLTANSLSSSTASLSVLGRVTMPVLKPPNDVRIVPAPRSRAIERLKEDGNNQPSEIDIEITQKFDIPYIAWRSDATKPQPLMTDTRDCFWEFLRFAAVHEREGLQEDECFVIDEVVLAFVRKYGPLDQLPVTGTNKDQEFAAEPIFKYGAIAYQYKGMLNVALALANSKPASPMAWKAATLYYPQELINKEWQSIQFDVVRQRKLFAELASSAVFSQHITPTMTWVGDHMEMHFGYNWSETDEFGEAIDPTGTVTDLLRMQLAGILTSPETALTCSICGDLFQADNLRGRRRGRIFCSPKCQEDGNRIKNKEAQQKKRATEKIKKSGTTLPQSE